MQMEDFDNFALETGKVVAQEEIENIETKIIEDVDNLMDHWAVTLGQRIQTRMNEMGFDQELEVQVVWKTKPPKFRIRGKTSTLE